MVVSDGRCLKCVPSSNVPSLGHSSPESRMGDDLRTVHPHAGCLGYTFTTVDRSLGGRRSSEVRRAKRDVKRLKRFLRRVEGECPACKRWIFASMFVHPCERRKAGTG